MTRSIARLLTLALALPLVAGCRSGGAVETAEGERWLPHAVYCDLVDDSP